MKAKEALRELVRGMTLEEKFRCCALKGDRFANIERLGTAFRCADNSSGGGIDYFRQSREKITGERFWGTCFPQAACQGAGWDPELAFEIGKAMGRECKNQGFDILLRPGVNMKRSPLCGRNFEYYSEDPWLSSELAAAFINGVQSEGVAANLKHFVCNNQEYERMTTNAVVDERTLNELYLRVFQLILQKSDPWTLMTSYNRVNGNWVHEHPDIMPKLRGEWGYRGMVMSDAFAVHYRDDKINGHKRGLDAELAEEDVHIDLLRNAYYQGEISEEELDAIALRVLDCYYKIHDGRETPAVDLNAHHALAKRAALEGAVLLKNDGILPLDAEKTERVAVIGAFAKEPSYMGGGSGHMNGHTLDIPYDELAKLLGGEEKLSYAPGYEIRYGFPPEDVPRPELAAEAAALARDAPLVILFAGYPYGVESEGYDRADLLLPESQRELLEAVLAVNGNVVLVVNAGAPLDLSAYAPRVRALLFGGYCGEAVGSAAAEILFGLAEPGGRLAETWPCRVEDTPAYLSYPRYPDTVPDVVYGEGIYIGYRWYDARHMEVAYPFGYGLSYASFAYGGLRLDAERLRPEDTLTVRFTVKNTGARPGSDVAQVYVRPLDSTIHRPEKELRAFRKVRLAPGGETEVELTLDRRAFEVYSPALHRWVAEAGRYEILVGRSSRDILLSATVALESNEAVKLFSPRTQVGHFVMDARMEKALAEQPEELRSFFELDANPMLPLCVAIPFGQFGDMDLGQGKLPRELIGHVVEVMNEGRV